MEASGFRAYIWRAAQHTQGAVLRRSWSVAARRFQQYVAGVYVGQLLAHRLPIGPVCDQYYVFNITDGQYAVHCHLQQAAARAEQVQELLGQVRAAHGPEARPDAATHYHAIAVVFLN